MTQARHALTKRRTHPLDALAALHSKTQALNTVLQTHARHALLERWQTHLLNALATMDIKSDALKTE